jgi:hypothetical protein
MSQRFLRLSPVFGGMVTQLRIFIRAWAGPARVLLPASTTPLLRVGDTTPVSSSVSGHGHHCGFSVGADHGYLSQHNDTTLFHIIFFRVGYPTTTSPTSAPTWYHPPPLHHHVTPPARYVKRPRSLRTSCAHAACAHRTCAQRPNIRSRTTVLCVIV